MHEKTRLEKIKDILGADAPSYRMKQIAEAIYVQGVKEYSQITTLPKPLREKLSKELGNEILSLKSVLETKDDQAHKILFETRDGHKIETVRMVFKPTKERDRDHISICISSQSGCPLGCKFCATGAIGFKKNLTPDEIADQVLYFRQLGLDVGNISFMGMGEPLINEDNVFEAIRIFTDKDLMGIGKRHISVSTVGIVPGIKRLTKDFPQVNLAFSLHTPFEDQREEIMPVTKSYSIENVFQALDEHVRKTKRKVFIAYALFGGLNDSQKHAAALVKLIKSRGKHSYLYHVNLIRYNAGDSAQVFKCPTKEKVDSFRATLERFGISVTLRQSFGTNINAACGQLYGGYEKKLKS
jgi:23S rRNA (adenine-C8)-methyltransferase